MKIESSCVVLNYFFSLYCGNAYVKRKMETILDQNFIFE